MSFYESISGVLLPIVSLGEVWVSLFLMFFHRTATQIGYSIIIVVGNCFAMISQYTMIGEAWPPGVSHLIVGFCGFLLLLQHRATKRE